MAVTIYSTPTCPYCKMAKEYLTEKKIEYNDVNVAENHEAAHQMVEKSGQMGVPQIEINGRFIVGFDKEAIDKELNL